MLATDPSLVVDIEATYKSIIDTFNIDLGHENNQMMFDKLVRSYTAESIVKFASVAHVDVIYKKVFNA